MHTYVPNPAVDLAEAGAGGGTTGREREVEPSAPTSPALVVPEAKDRARVAEGSWSAGECGSSISRVEGFLIPSLLCPTFVPLALCYF